MSLLQNAAPLLDANIFTGRGRPCTQWELGRFLVPVEPFTPPKLSKPCDNFDNGSFKHGRWVVVSDSDCTAQWLHPMALRGALHNKSIVFMGDSLVRQLFLRLVSYLRGIPDQVERPFHTDAVYAFNATHDYFFNGRTWANSMLPNAVFKAHFFWDHNAGNVNPRNLVPGYSVRVLGFHYHMADEGFMARVPRNYGGDNRTLYMTTPTNDNVNNNDSRFDARNTWIRQQPHLPLEAMARTRVIGRSEDNMHFQCSFDCPALFEQVYDADPLPLLRKKIRMPFSGDCRDMINLNMIMMTTHFAASLGPPPA